MRAKRAFRFSMRKYERVIGLLYIPVQAVLLVYMLAFALRLTGLSLTEPMQNLACYAFSALFVLLTMHRYWKESLRSLVSAPSRTLQAVILGYVFYYFADWAMSYVVAIFISEPVNPNSSEVITQFRLDGAAIFVVAVIFAPIVEETLFRGALFGTLRTKSRALAYAVSIIAFGVYHIWPYLLYDGNPRLLAYILQYVPASLALAWCYEWSDTICAPVILHAAINLVVTVSIAWTP